MLTLNRLTGALATCVLVAATSAYADEPTLTDPPSKCDKVPADCPGAQAQTEPAPAPQATPPPPMAMEEPAVERPWYDRIGYGLSLGGGVDDFVGSEARDFTNVGGSWNLRFTAGTKSYLALEGSYIGSAQSINVLGLDTNAVLVGNGHPGCVAYQRRGNYVVQPFVYGGAAWRNYSLSNTVINTSDVTDNANEFEVPLGIGFAGYIHGFMADVRGEYRFAWGDELVPRIGLGDSGSIDTSLDRWGVTGNIGMEF